jgi:hypothetical protein
MFCIVRPLQIIFFLRIFICRRMCRAHRFTIQLQSKEKVFFALTVKVSMWNSAFFSTDLTKLVNKETDSHVCNVKFVIIKLDKLLNRMLLSCVGCAGSRDSIGLYFPGWVRSTLWSRLVTGDRLLRGFAVGPCGVTCKCKWKILLFINAK